MKPVTQLAGAQTWQVLTLPDCALFSEKLLNQGSKPASFILRITEIKRQIDWAVKAEGNSNASAMSFWKVSQRDITML